MLSAKTPAVRRRALFLLVAAVAACRGSTPEPPPEPAAPAAAPSYVGRQSCTRCHPDQDRLWRGSHHDLAMQEATERTVLGDFDDAELTHGGDTTTFFRRDGGFFVRTKGPDGELGEYEVEYTFGAVPLQQYLVTLSGGRLQALTACWDSRPAREGGQRWFHLYPDDAPEPGDPLHWTGPFLNWNHMCAECHSTNLDKGYDEAADRYRTTFSEIDVSCEACHGPGSEHEAWARAAARGEATPKVERFGLAVRLKDPGRGTWIIHPENDKGVRLAPPVETAEIETCARCHSRRATLTGNYRFGRPLGDSHRLALLEPELYHADGQLLDEVYVHGSYLQSRMHAAGVTCSDCHDPHALDLLFPGDRVCDRCHTAARFASREHHFHEPGTAGSGCVDCHMPPRTYMRVDPRHDHSLRIPRPDLSVELGTPNACNGCHDDRTASWAAETVARWYGPGRRAEPHWGETLWAARNFRADAGPRLGALAADDEAPAIVRASALALLRDFLTARLLVTIEQALADPDPLVRRAALAAMESVGPETRLGLGAPLLDDPVLAVRIEAARVLTPVPDDRLGAGQLSSLRAALGEYEEVQRYNADRAEGRLNLAWLHLQRYELDEAERELLAALGMAPWLGSAYVNLADLYRLLERDAEGERVLRRGLELAADGAAIHHALGLLLVRRQRQSEALEHLEKAAALAPDVPRYAYVHAVALSSAGSVAEAVAVLRRAHDRFPAERDILLALVTINRDRGAPGEALDWARRLARLVPDDPRVEQLVASLEGG